MTISNNNIFKIGYFFTILICSIIATDVARMVESCNMFYFAFTAFLKSLVKLNTNEKGKNVVRQKKATDYYLSKTHASKQASPYICIVLI